MHHDTRKSGQECEHERRPLDSLHQLSLTEGSLLPQEIPSGNDHPGRHQLRAAALLPGRFSLNPDTGAVDASDPIGLIASQRGNFVADSDCGVDALEQVVVELGWAAEPEDAEPEFPKTSGRGSSSSAMWRPISTRSPWCVALVSS